MENNGIVMLAAAQPKQTGRGSVVHKLITVVPYDVSYTADDIVEPMKFYIRLGFEAPGSRDIDTVILSSLSVTMFNATTVSIDSSSALKQVNESDVLERDPDTEFLRAGRYWQVAASDDNDDDFAFRFTNLVRSEPVLEIVNVSQVKRDNDGDDRGVEYQFMFQFEVYEYQPFRWPAQEGVTFSLPKPLVIDENADDDKDDQYFQWEVLEMYDDELVLVLKRYVGNDEILQAIELVRSKEKRMNTLTELGDEILQIQIIDKRELSKKSGVDAAREWLRRQGTAVWRYLSSFYTNPSHITPFLDRRQSVIPGPTVETTRQRTATSRRRRGRSLTPSRRSKRLNPKSRASTPGPRYRYRRLEHRRRSLTPSRRSPLLNPKRRASTPDMPGSSVITPGPTYTAVEDESSSATEPEDGEEEEDEPFVAVEVEEESAPNVAADSLARELNIAALPQKKKRKPRMSEVERLKFQGTHGQPDENLTGLQGKQVRPRRYHDTPPLPPPSEMENAPAAATVSPERSVDASNVSIQWGQRRQPRRDPPENISVPPSLPPKKQKKRKPRMTEAERLRSTLKHAQPDANLTGLEGRRQRKGRGQRKPAGGRISDEDEDYVYGDGDNDGSVYDDDDVESIDLDHIDLESDSPSIDLDHIAVAGYDD